MDFLDLHIKKQSVFDKINDDSIREPITINISRFYTDVDGTVIDKSTVPANLQVSYPFYLFGTFDKNGAYKIGNKIVPPLGAAKYMYSKVVRSQYDFLEFTGLNNVKINFNIGDMVFLYTDDLNAPTYFIWILISCPFQSYASVINNLSNKFLLTDEIFYHSDSFENFNESIFEVLNSPVGTYKVNTLQPLVFASPSYAKSDIFIKIDRLMKLTQYIGWYSYMQYGTDSLSFNFRLKYK